MNINFERLLSNYKIYSDLLANLPNLAAIFPTESERMLFVEAVKLHIKDRIVEKEETK